MCNGVTAGLLLYCCYMFVVVKALWHLVDVKFAHKTTLKIDSYQLFWGW